MTVHRDPARLNHFFSVAARRNAGMREDLLKPLLHILIVGVRVNSNVKCSDSREAAIPTFDVQEFSSPAFQGEDSSDGSTISSSAAAWFLMSSSNSSMLGSSLRS